MTAALIFFDTHLLMTTRTKSILMLLATFLIGMLVGALLNARMAEDRIERMALLRSRAGFIRFVETAVEPRDDQQRAAIRAILEDAATRMSRHTEQSRTQVRMILDSTRAELETVLTEDQIRRLDDRMRLREHHMRDRRDRPGPRRRQRRPGPPGP